MEQQLVTRPHRRLIDLITLEMLINQVQNQADPKAIEAEQVVDQEPTSNEPSAHTSTQPQSGLL